MKICFSYSCDAAYLPYLKKSLDTLNKNAPRCFANIDIINSPGAIIENNNIEVTHTNQVFFEEHILIKNKTSEILKERFVGMAGAYANLKKVYNVYDLLFKYDYVINMDADNIVLKNLLNFEQLKNDDFDILIRYRDEPLFGNELNLRKNNFNAFDISMINLENEDRRFREGCFIVKNNDITKAYFKYIQDNILNQIEWYADSYWFLRAFQKFKSNIKIKKLPSNFVAYDLDTELNGAFVASGYGINKHSSIYKTLLNLYD